LRAITAFKSSKFHGQINDIHGTSSTDSPNRPSHGHHRISLGPQSSARVATGQPNTVWWSETDSRCPLSSSGLASVASHRSNTPFCETSMRRSGHHRTSLGA
jgi:hypothetical protein